MITRVLPVACALTAGLSVLALSAPAHAAPLTPGTQALAAHAGLAPASLRAAAATGPVSAISVDGNVRTAYSGRYAKFPTSFRCERGRYYQLIGAVEQYRGEEVSALATSAEDGPTGACSGRTQHRMVYVVIGSPDPEQHAPAAALRSGRGQATAVLVTTRTRRSSALRLDAASIATVRVAPR